MLLLNAQIKSSIVDLIILAILLIFIIIGIKQGFLRQAVNLVSGIASFVIAYCFCDNLLDLISNKTNILVSLSDKLTSSLSKNSILGTEFNPETFKSNLESLNIPNFIIEAVSKISIGNETTSLAALLSQVLAKYILLSICFISLFLLCKFLFVIIKKIASLFNNIIVIGTINRILGSLLGFIKGLLFVYFALFIINTFIPLSNGVSTILSSSRAVTILSKYNIFVYLFNYLTK